jgi:hypothetical protein
MIRRNLRNLWYSLIKTQEQIAWTQQFSWGAISRDEYLKKMDEIDERYDRIRGINDN